MLEQLRRVGPRRVLVRVVDLDHQLAHTDAVTQREVNRCLDVWREALHRSGGPFLFGRFTIADCMYYPMRTRFRSYGVPIPNDLTKYVTALDEAPAVTALIEVARTAPRVPAYDEYLRDLGGDPDAAL